MLANFLELNSTGLYQSSGKEKESCCRVISDLRRKGIILRALMWAVTSLWPHKVVCVGQMYSVRAKLKLIYWPGQSLVKKCFEGWPRRVPSKTARLCQQSWHVLICRESESYWERVFWWYFARISCGNIVLGWLWIVLSVPRTWLIVRFPEVSVDRQISGMSWRSCYKNIVYKYKNALWVFSWSNFVLDSQLWGQERWILGMF